MTWAAIDSFKLRSSILFDSIDVCFTGKLFVSHGKHGKTDPSTDLVTNKHFVTFRSDVTFQS